MSAYAENSSKADLMALEIVYNMAVKYSKGPLGDDEMDALLMVRKMLEIALKAKP